MILPVTHSDGYIKYQNLYFGKENLHRNEGVDFFFPGLVGDRYFAPILQDVCSRRTQRNIYDEIYAMIDKDTPVECNLESGYNFATYLLDKGYTPKLKTMLVYVTYDESDIRKSYKPLINKAKREGYTTKVIFKPETFNIDIYKRMHIAVAGKQTRSDATWKQQELNVLNGDAFIVVVLNDAGLMVGYALFDCTKSEALYSVGVYDRLLEATGVPLGHLSLEAAMLEVRKRNIDYLTLGERHWAYEQVPSKEYGISFFKEGFSNYYQQKVVMTNVRF